MPEGRTLLNFQPLPKRERVLDRDQVDKDIREAIGLAERRLLDQSQHLGVTGWQIDTSYGPFGTGFEFGLMDHTVVGRLRLVRS